MLAVLSRVLSDPQLALAVRLARDSGSSEALVRFLAEQARRGRAREPSLLNDLVLEGVGTARQLPDRTQAEALHYLSDVAPESPAARALVGLAGSVPDEELSGEILIAAAPAAPDLASARLAGVSNPWQQIELIRALAPHLGESTLSSVLNTAMSMEPTARNDACAALAPYLPYERQSEVLAAIQGEEEIWSGSGLTGMFADLKGDLRGAALRMITEMEDPWDQGMALAAVVPYAEGEELLTIARASLGLGRGDARDLVIPALARKLARQAGSQGEVMALLEQVSEPAVWADAAEIIGVAGTSQIRQALLQASGALPQDARRARLRIELCLPDVPASAADLDRALGDLVEAVRREPWGINIMWWSSLVRRLPEGHLEPVIQAARLIAQSGLAVIGVGLLLELADRRAASSGDASGLLAEAADWARTISSPSQRAAALVEAAARSEGTNKDQLITLAVRSVHRVPAVNQGAVAERLGDRLDVPGRRRLLGLAVLHPQSSPRGWRGVFARTVRDLAAKADQAERSEAIDRLLDRADRYPQLTAPGLFPLLRSEPPPPWSAEEAVRWLNTWIPAGTGYDVVIEPPGEEAAARPEDEAAAKSRVRPTTPPRPKIFTAPPPDIPAAVVNLGFAPVSAPARTIGRSGWLRPGQLYWFWVEVGPELADNIDAVPTRLPDDLAVGSLLRVVVFGFSGELRSDPAADTGVLQLQADGSASVAATAGQPELESGSGLLRRRLFFPVRTPSQEGVHRLRCSIYASNVLVQSWLVTAAVRQGPGNGGIRARGDYRLARSLSVGHLAGLQPHRLSILANSDADGTHRFTFVGEGGVKTYADFADDEVQDFITSTRAALRLCAWGTDRPWTGERYTFGTPAEGDQALSRLLSTLIPMARAGFRAYDALVDRFAGGVDQVAALEEAMARTGMIQLALRRSARTLLPLACIYDYAFETNAPGEEYSLCPRFSEAVRRHEDLEQLACFIDSCSERGDRTLCPSGFWGFRHDIGAPVDIDVGRPVATGVSRGVGLHLTIGVSTDSNLVERAPHVNILHQLCPDPSWHYTESRNGLFGLMRTAPSQIVYLYCHAGVQGRVPYLQVGPLAELGITRDNIRYQRIRWTEPRPLVFINGCQSGAVEPELALDLVSGFISTAGAAGVIGTEITVFEPLARVIAESALTAFLAGAPIGRAMRRAGSPNLTGAPPIPPSLPAQPEPVGVRLRRPGRHPPPGYLR